MLGLAWPMGAGQNTKKWRTGDPRSWLVGALAVSAVEVTPFATALQGGCLWIGCVKIDGGAVSVWPSAALAAILRPSILAWHSIDIDA